MILTWTIKLNYYLRWYFRFSSILKEGKASFTKLAPRDLSLMVKHVTFNHYNMGSDPVDLRPATTPYTLDPLHYLRPHPGTWLGVIAVFFYLRKFFQCYLRTGEIT